MDPNRFWGYSSLEVLSISPEYELKSDESLRTRSLVNHFSVPFSESFAKL